MDFVPNLVARNLVVRRTGQPDKELSHVRKLRSMHVNAIVFTGSGLGDED